ncbi:MAG: glycosyltransferase [Acidobacteria bacterium ACB1]|nr:D-inositol-3-phosphate glycosyltransferase [Pyrinomonadaceae bacterium]MCE7962960.1 glycosyltransferase [Acidobacteria bacterium ACB1]RIJ89829.1 MAG: hypothetical protein DCC44_11525 [Acidobacteriota bacterium]
MEVCFLAGTLGRGGAERQLIFMLRALKNAGIRTRLLCLTSGEALEEEIRDLGVEISSIDRRGGRLSTLRNVVKELRRQPSDIVQSSHFYTNIYVSIAGRLNGIPSIGAIRSDLAFELASNGFYGKYQLKLPRHLIANSGLALERAVNFGVARDRIDLVRNVVTCEGQKRDTSNASPKATKILFVGRLGEEKRPELFVELAHELLSTLPDRQLKFQVVGDGPLRPKLETLARGYGIGPDILSLDGERPEISDVYKSADLVVLTSKHEGTPNVVLEAMSHSLPVVATKVGGVPEILDSTAGIVVDPMDFRGLLSATTELILDRETRTSLGINGQRYVRKNHSLRYLEERLTGIYTKLLERKHNGRG